MCGGGVKKVTKHKIKNFFTKRGLIAFLVPFESKRTREQGSKVSREQEIKGSRGRVRF